MKIPTEFGGGPPRPARVELARRCTLGKLRTQLEELEQKQHGRASSASPAPRSTHVPTGFAALDDALGGGWQRGALNELLVAVEGSGASEAFLPALCAPRRDADGALDSAAARLVAWIDPARVPYPPALRQAGLDLARLLVVRPRDLREQAWALDLALRSGACDVVITWLPRLDDTLLRRLQLAAEEGGALGLFFRPSSCARAASPAAIRLVVAPLPSPVERSSLRRLQVTPLRCRGATPFVALAGCESLVLEWSRDPLDEPASAALRARALPARLDGARGAAVRALGA